MQKSDLYVYGEVDEAFQLSKVSITKRVPKNDPLRIARASSKSFRM